MGKNGKMNLSICICFAFILLSRLFFCFYFAFILHLLCFLPGKKANKMQNKSNKKQIEQPKYINAKQMQMDKSVFSPCFFPSWRSFFSHLFCFRFFQFWSFAFWCSTCLPFVSIFSSLKIIRISYWGEHNPSSIPAPFAGNSIAVGPRPCWCTRYIKKRRNLWTAGKPKECYHCTIRTLTSGLICVIQTQ